MTRPYGSADPYPRGSAISRSFLPLALITLGVVFLLSNLVPERARGGLIVLGLGAGFLVGRVTTGRYGYAVPAGILSAIGLYIIVHDVQAPPLFNASGVFFVLLGFGFALAYAIGWRRAAIWPLFPAGILVALGLVLLGVSSLGPLASLSWITGYWPLALVLLGVWLLFRESLPPAVRPPIATLGGLALLAYGIVAALASVAAGGALERSGVTPNASSQFNGTTVVDQPIGAGQTLTVNNTSGSTTLRAGNETTVHVLASQHFTFAGQPPDVSLTPTSDGLLLSSPARGRGGFPFSGQGSVDYTVDVPSGVAVTVHSSSGSINLSGISGEVRAYASSGSILGSQLQHVREVQTSSGSISLDGAFSEPASVSASSGSVTLRLLPGSAVDLNVHSGSGSVQPQGGLLLSGGVTRRSELTGAIGVPAAGATLNVQTSSGNVVISQ